MCCFLNETLYILFWFSTCRFRNIGNQDTRVRPYTRAWFFPIFNLCHTLWSKIIWFLNPLSNENFRKYFPVKQKRNTERSLNSAEIRIFHEHSESIQWYFRNVSVDWKEKFYLLGVMRLILILSNNKRLLSDKRNRKHVICIYFIALFFKLVPTWYKMYKCI